MHNPVIRADFPDPDIIRVGNVYYMLCPTRHFRPGGVILRSYNLTDWEIAGYVFDKLESTPGEKLQGEQSAYGYGMEDGSIRYHKGMFYVTFCNREMESTYVFSSESIEGPWKKTTINQFYYHGSLLFDDNDRIYIAYGYRSIYLQELKRDLSGPMEGGTFKRLLRDEGENYVPFCGTHFQKIAGRYHLLVTNIPKKLPAVRVQYCFSSADIAGTYTGGEILCDDMGYFNQGIAQGGFVDTPEGKWYTILGQDRGAVGRLPVLQPVEFKNGQPVIGANGKCLQIFETEKSIQKHVYEPVVCSDDFGYMIDENKKFVLKKQWQWNHEPDDRLWQLDENGGLILKTGKISANLIHAQNTLTQRCIYPGSSVEVTIENERIKEGDFAGICILQGCYGFIGITKELNRYYLTVVARELKESPVNMTDSDYLPGTLKEKLPVDSSKVKLKIVTDFENQADTAAFFYETEEGFQQLGKKHLLYFKVDHFMGARYGLFLFSTKETGGTAVFKDFKYITE